MNNTSLCTVKEQAQSQWFVRLTCVEYMYCVPSILPIVSINAHLFWSTRNSWQYDGPWWHILVEIVWKMVAAGLSTWRLSVSIAAPHRKLFTLELSHVTSQYTCNLVCWKNNSRIWVLFILRSIWSDHRIETSFQHQTTVLSFLLTYKWYCAILAFLPRELLHICSLGAHYRFPS